MATLQLNAQARELTGRKVKQIRREGLIPVVVYGNVDSALSLQVPEREFERTLREGGSSQLIEIHVADGSTHNVLVRDVQRHPVRRTLMHADFYAINLREKQQVLVPVTSVNEPETLSADLMVLQALDAVEIEALPTDIPASIEIDIGELTLENDITVADLPAIEGVEYITDPEEPIFTMIVSRVAAEEEALDAELGDEEELGEAEDAAEDEGEAEDSDAE